MGNNKSRMNVTGVKGKRTTTKNKNKRERESEIFGFNSGVYSEISLKEEKLHQPKTHHNLEDWKGKKGKEESFSQ